jgi:hypothetical protein
MPGGTKKRQQDLAVEALLSEPTIPAAAAKAKIGERTLRRWLAEDPDFLGAYRRARARTVEQAVALLQRLCEQAVGTLQGALNCKHPPTRVRAACAILDRALRGVELLDHEERLAALEMRR